MQWCSNQNPTSSYAMDHRDWPGKQWWAEHQACHCTRFTQTLKPFWRLILNVSFLFQNSTLCQQNRIFCRHVIFSQNCCFVTNFVDKALIDDSTRWNMVKFFFDLWWIQVVVQQAPPPKFWLTMFFFLFSILFCIRMLQNEVQIAWESI